MQFFSYIFFICALFAMVMGVQVNIDGDIKAADRLQRANEFAVHDGAIPLNFSDFSQGEFAFDQVQGKKNYIDSVSYSLKATWSGSQFVPKSDSYFQEPIELVYLEFVDSTNPACPSFPCTFTVPNINKTESLAGPSVLAIVKTTTPRYFPGEPEIIQRLSIYEYK